MSELSDDARVRPHDAAAQRICVFAGSSPGARPEYAAAARDLGAALAARGCTLVYGGARVGLMGALADAAMAAGGRVVGVIPEGLLAREVAHHGITELHRVDSMPERKALMAEMADAFVALPGGIGTFEEFFEMLTLAQLGLHAKPCGVLDVAGYYDPLRAMVTHAVRERFVREEHGEMIIAEAEPAALLDRLAAYEPPSVGKWIDRTAD